MRKSYITSVAGTLAAVVLAATGAVYAAQTDWAPLRSNEPAHPSSVKYEESPISKALGRKPERNPLNQVVPLRDGEHTLPAMRSQKMRPQSIFRSPEAPRGNCYAVVNRYTEMEYAHQAYVGPLDLTTGRLTRLYSGAVFCPYIGDDYLYQGNSYRKGQIICPNYTNISETLYGASWTLVDIETGEITDKINFNDQLADAYSVTYDPDRDIFYTIAIDMNNSEGDSYFGIVNPNGATGWEYYAGGRLETKNNQKPFIAAIAYNPVDKQVYAFDNNNYVYSIEWDGSLGMKHPEYTLVSVGEIYMPDESVLFECDSNDPMAGQITYSPMDEMFVAVYRDNRYRVNRIVYVHPETFEAFIGADVNADSTPFVCSIFCVDDMASSDAPMLAPAPVLSFTDGSLSGSIALSTPTESFIGLDLSGKTLKAVTKIDGEVKDERNVTAGQSFTLNLTLEQGLHSLEFTTEINGETSPVNTVPFYVGFDAPQAPTNIRLDLNHLTWDVPAQPGVNKGYVDTDDITYDVYLNDVKQNSQPLTVNEFDITVPETMAYSDIAVTASSHGQTSPKGSIKEIFGKAFELPFLQAPTKEQSSLYTIVNANNDYRTFYYGTNSGVEGMIFLCGYTDDADDWLFLPAINFPDNKKLYSFEADLRGVYTDLLTAESFEVYLADRATVESALKGTQIYADYNLKVSAATIRHHNMTFAVPEAGDYYIAIHMVSTREQSSQGLTFHNFEVKALDGSTSAVPGEPTNVTVVPAQFGEQMVTATATLPTVDILGNPLPADEDITLTLTYADDAGYTYSQQVTGKPGETVSVTNGGDRDGFIYYTLTPSNSHGSGYARSYRVYVGVDIPLAPRNIQGVPSADNLSLNLTWEAPEEIGKNGGYIDLTAPDFKYTVYVRSGTSYNKIADTRDLAYTFYPFGVEGTGKLESYLVGPGASNSAGQSQNSLFVSEVLGQPLELPLKEEWNSSLFNYSPYNFVTTGAYSASDWASAGTTLGLGIGDPSVIEGCIFTFSAAGHSLSKLILPKATTKGIMKVNFILKYWDFAEAPKTIRIFGRSDKTNEETLISEITTNRPSKGEWVEAEIPLTENFIDSNWVQLLVETELFGGENEYLVLDSFQLMPDADYDLKLTTLSGLTQATIGDVLTYDVTVANAGRERLGAPLSIQLIDKATDKVLASDNVQIDALTSNQTFDHSATFQLDGTFSKIENVIVRASIDAEDENLSNNTRELQLTIMPSQLPAVDDLEATLNDDGTVALTWSAPSATYGNFDNFDAYKPFQTTETLGFWQNKDLDGMQPIYFQNQATGAPLLWENSESPCAWMVYDYEAMGAPEARIKPHSGNQAIMARCGMYPDENVPVQSSKWLISPEIVPQSALSFWYSTLTTDYKEFVELWVSETPNGEGYLDPTDSRLPAGKCGTFTKVTSFSKMGAEDWEYVTYRFNSRTRQFALRYCSYDSFCAVLDDISFTPANMLTRTPASYSVYRCELDGSNPVMIAENITATSFTDTNFNDAAYRYYVVANSDIDGHLAAGAPSNHVTVIGSSVDEISGDVAVVAGKGVINVINLAGQETVIAAADGKIVAKAVNASAHSAYAVESGVYVVTVGRRSYKVIVK